MESKRCGVPGLMCGLLLLILWAFLARGQECDPSRIFGPALSFPAQAVGGVNVVVGDFNRDGIPDVATESNTGAGFVSVLIGTERGGYESVQRYSTNQARPFGLAVGDVNSDGFIDILSGDRDSGGSGRIALLLGSGDGSFMPSSNLPGIFIHGSELVLSDMNHDGMLDLLVADADNDRLLYMRGNGDGTFGAAVPVPAGDAPYYFSVVDADGDGNSDLITGNSNSDDLSIIRGDGTGQFFAQRRFFSGNGPQRPLMADFNADGLMDYAVANNLSDSVVVRLANGDPLVFHPRIEYAVGDGPRHVRVADFNGDAIKDIIVTNVNNDVSLLIGVGDGTFEPQVRFPANGRPEDGAAFDANNDGAIDFVVVNSTTQDITPLLNTCDPAPCPPDLDGDRRLTIFDFLAFQNLFDAGDPLADFDGDGSLTLFDFLAFQNAFDAGCP